METLLALALQGVGACISPLNLVEATATPEQKRGLHIYDLGPDAGYNLGIALSANARRWQPACDVIQILREQ